MTLEPTESYSRADLDEYAAILREVAETAVLNNNYLMHEVLKIRGDSARVLQVRDNVRLVEGRFLTPGLAEAVVGRGARSAYQGLDLGATVRIGAGSWTIVGVFDGQGTAFDSEVWADARILNGFYQRPPSVYQSVTVRLRSPEEFPAFEAAPVRLDRFRVQFVTFPTAFLAADRVRSITGWSTTDDIDTPGTPRHVPEEPS